jgi:hypothetical protein
MRVGKTKRHGRPAFEHFCCEEQLLVAEAKVLFPLIVT